MRMPCRATPFFLGFLLTNGLKMCFFTASLFDTKPIFTGEFPMSMHRSLKGSSKIAKRRNVLKRYERVDIMKERGEWKAGDRAFGLRKTKPVE
jgi:small basic protein (TIGR04137 family)